MPSSRLILLALAVATASIRTDAAPAARVNTTEGRINGVLPPPTQAEVDQAAQAVRLPKDLAVPSEWVPYLNAAYEEYWTEGNHRPDAGFVLFARSPTPQNAKLWLLRMESKAKNLERLFALVRDAQADLVKAGMMKDRYDMVSTAKAGTLPKVAATPAPPDGGKAALAGLEFFFLYSPECPHCARMAQSLVGFPNVKPLQVTNGPVTDWPGLAPSDRATPDTIAAYVGDGGVPVLVIHEPTSKRLLPLRGARSASEIMQAAAKLANGDIAAPKGATR